MAVRWLTCVQAQDLPGALTSVALRVDGGTRADVVAALDAGEVVRSWPMRGTLHFTAAEDIGWMAASPRHEWWPGPHGAASSSVSTCRLRAGARSLTVAALSGGTGSRAPSCWPRGRPPACPPPASGATTCSASSR